MNIGTLDTRCRIERKTVTKDSTYQTEVEAWELVGVRYCNVQDVLPSRSESMKGGLEVAGAPTRLRLNYATDVDVGMRVIINRPSPTIYQIISGPAILGDKDGLEFMIERLTTENTG